VSEAQAILAELRDRGVSLRSADGRLRFRPAAAVSPELRARLASQKAALLDVLELFEERAAIMEHDGGLPREEAERRAWESVLGLTTEAAP
jgi:hypothetical protein